MSDGGTAGSGGHVEIYENQSGSWVQLGSNINGEDRGDGSGNSVSISSDGTVVAIGASGNDGNGIVSGHVRVFENQSGSWVQIGSDIDGEEANSESGWSVSLSSDGTIVAIGARQNDGNGEKAGHVRVFESQSDSWVQIGSDIDGEAASYMSGSSVSISSDGTIVAIGSPEATHPDPGFPNGAKVGHVRVFEREFTKAEWLAARTAGQNDVTGDPASYSLYTASDVTSAEATARTAGQTDVTSDPASYSLYTASDVTGAEATARTAGRNDVTSNPGTYSLYTASDVTSAEATARTVGRNDVTSDPATYSLYTAVQLSDASNATQAQLDAERTAGQNDVTDDPVTYSLYTASDVTSAEATAHTAGQTDVTSDPATYSLYTASDVTTAEAAARTAGQTDVTGDPATYSLYTTSELVTAALTARVIEKDDIINNPTIHGLFGENTVEDVRIGAPMMRKNSEGKLLFDFQIQASDDLQNWTTIDTPEYEVIPSSDKEFLRVRVSNE